MHHRAAKRGWSADASNPFRAGRFPIRTWLLVLPLVGLVLIALAIGMRAKPDVVVGTDPPSFVTLVDGSYRSIVDAIAVARDPARALTAARVLELYSEGRLERVQTPYLNMLPTKGAYWAAFALTNASGEAGRWVVDLRRPHLLELEVHVDRGDGLRPLVALSPNAAVVERPIAGRYHAFALDLAAEETVMLVIGYRSFETGWLAPHVGSPEAVLRAHGPEDALNWFANGVLIAMIAFVTVMVPVIGWRIGLAFIAYLGAGLSFVAHADNYLFALLTPALRAPIDMIGLLLGLLMTLTALVLARTLFETGRTQPGPDRAYRVLLALLSVLIVLLPLAYGNATFHAVAYGIVLVTSLCHPAIGLLALRQGQVGARPFLIGSPLIVGSLFYAAVAHLVPGQFSIERTLDVGQITLLVEAFAFALAILVRTRNLRRERDAAVDEAMNAANARLMLLEALSDSERRFEMTTVTAEEARTKLATIGHDIRQPLVSLRATLERLGDVPDAASKRMRDAFAYMEELARSADPPADGKDEAAEASETFEIGIILENTVAMFRHEADELGIALRHEPSRACVTARPVPLMRIVNNLVANAVRHSDARMIDLRVVESAGTRAVEVADDGRGMDPEMLAAMHSIGAKGANSSGEGFGLAIVRDLAEREGFGFELASTPGRGTLARVTLPASAWSAHPSTARTTLRGSPVSRQV